MTNDPNKPAPLRRTKSPKFSAAINAFFVVTYLALIAEYIWVKVTEFQHLSSRGFGKISKIASYRALWLHLSKLTQELGNATGLTYGGQTLLLFAISVLVIYGFMIELTEDFDIILFITGLLFLIIIFSQCNSAHGAASEVCTCFLIPTCFFLLKKLFSVECSFAKSYNIVRV